MSTTMEPVWHNGPHILQFDTGLTDGLIQAAYSFDAALSKVDLLGWAKLSVNSPKQHFNQLRLVQIPLINVVVQINSELRQWKQRLTKSRRPSDEFTQKVGPDYPRQSEHTYDEFNKAELCELWGDPNSRDDNLFSKIIVPLGLRSSSRSWATFNINLEMKRIQ